MSEKAMVLSGDSNVPAMPMTEAEVNHLRRVLAWMRCEYMLDESAQRGMLGAVQELTACGAITPEVASQHVAERAAQINHVPAYIRQGVKMLTKALREHEKRSGVVDATVPHQDHPLRHWDRTCPACNPNAATPGHSLTPPQE